MSSKIEWTPQIGDRVAALDMSNEETPRVRPARIVATETDGSGMLGVTFKGSPDPVLVDRSQVWPLYRWVKVEGKGEAMQVLCRAKE